MAKEKKYYFIQLQDVFFERVDIKKLRTLPQGDSLVLIYLKLLMKVMNNKGHWIYENIIPVKYEELAFWLDEDPMLTALLVKALLDMGLAAELDSDEIYFYEAQELTTSITDAALRKRKSRETKKQLLLNEKKQLCDNVTDVSHIVRVKELELEVEREVDKELELEVDKNIVEDEITFNKSDEVYKGIFNNITLTSSEWEKLERTYVEPYKLVDHISTQIYKHGYNMASHYAFAIKCGNEDKWKTLAEERQIIKEKEHNEKEYEELVNKQIEEADKKAENWYLEKFKEYNVTTKEDVDDIFREMMKHHNFF